MVKFWDSSAILSIVLDEAASEFMKALLISDKAQMVVWWNTTVECHSAISRLRRMNKISDIEVSASRKVLLDMTKTWETIASANEIGKEAIRLVYGYPLKAADALQLAAAKIWARYSNEERYFVCLDARLREAAAKEGLKIVPAKI